MSKHFRREQCHFALPDARFDYGIKASTDLDNFLKMNVQPGTFQGQLRNDNPSNFVWPLTLPCSDKTPFELEDDEKLRKDEDDAIKLLPAYKDEKKINEAIVDNAVTFITGNNGCGKTTQIPIGLALYLKKRAKKEHGDALSGDELDALSRSKGRVLVATSNPEAVANRVAKECKEKVGYRIGFKSPCKQPLCCEKTIVMFCSADDAIKMMYEDYSTAPHDSIAGLTPQCRASEKIPVVFIDDIHERNSDKDFLLYALLELTALRPDLKIVLTGQSCFDMSSPVSFFSSLIKLGMMLS